MHVRPRTCLITPSASFLLHRGRCCVLAPLARALAELGLDGGDLEESERVAFREDGLSVELGLVCRQGSGEGVVPCIASSHEVMEVHARLTGAGHSSTPTKPQKRTTRSNGNPEPQHNFEKGGGGGKKRCIAPVAKHRWYVMWGRRARGCWPREVPAPCATARAEPTLRIGAMLSIDTNTVAPPQTSS